MREEQSRIMALIQRAERAEARADRAEAALRALIRSNNRQVLDMLAAYDAGELDGV